MGTAQIADASITDAKIVNLSANSITAGTLSVERLIIVGGDQSIVFAINSANGTAQLSSTTIDGGSLTQRSITADRVVAGTITANEIAAATIIANNIASGAITTDKLAAESVDASKIKAGSITTEHVASNFGESLNLSSNQTVRTVVTQNVSEAIAEISVGGVNLIADSARHTIVSEDYDTCWIAADELTPGASYTFSVRETTLDAGSAAGISWALVNQDDGVTAQSGTLDFTYGKQRATMLVPETEGNWSFCVYAGIRGSTYGVTVTLVKTKLEEGNLATDWSPAAEDTDAQLNSIAGDVESLDSGMNARVQSLIDVMGLSDQFASAEDFLAALSDMDMIRSQLSQTDSGLTLSRPSLILCKPEVVVE